MASPILKTDFSTVISVFLPLELSVYPAVLQSGVKRIRDFAESKLTVHSKPIGEGGFGLIHMGKYTRKDNVTIPCAIKLFKVDDPYASKHAMQEAEMHWQSIGAPHAVALHGCFSRGQEKGIAIDYIEGPNLLNAKLVSSCRTSDALLIASQLLHYLVEIQTPTQHRPSPLVNGDLCTDNMFWVGKKLVIIDPGIMAPKDKMTSQVVQKAYERAPELFLNQVSQIINEIEQVRYSESIDMWSVGIIIHELITGTKWSNWPQPSHTWGEEEISLIIHRIGMPDPKYVATLCNGGIYFEYVEGTFQTKAILSNLLPEVSLSEIHSTCPYSSPKIYDLISKILVWDPSKRLTPTQALDHPVFKSKE
jgi:serine/threonine protein kinase